MNCSINQNIRNLRKDFIKDFNYENISKKILENNEEGYFYDINEVADKFEKLFARKGDIPFSKRRLIHSFYSALNINKVSSKNEFFNKPLSDLYKNGNESMEYMLNNKIQKYKNELFQTLFKYLSKNSRFKEKYSKIPYNNLYENKRFNKSANYKEVLDDIAELFKDYSTNVSIYKESKELDVLHVYNAAVILSNFDSIVESKFNNIISVNQYNLDSLTDPVHTFHYIQEFKGISTSYWAKSGHSSEGADNYSSSFIKMLSGTIPLLDIDGNVLRNRYLGMNRLYLIGSLLKWANNTQKYSELDFQSNPKGKLKEFLEALIAEKKLEHSSTLNSLYKYLYDRKTGVVRVVNSIKGNNPEIAPNIIDIEAIVAHQLNNIMAPTYGSYDTKEGKKLLSLVGRETLSDEIVDSIVKHVQSVNYLFNSLKLSETSKTEIAEDGTSRKVRNVSVEHNGVSIDLLSPEGYKLIENLTGINFDFNVRSLITKTIQGSVKQSAFDLLKASKEMLSEYSKDNTLSDEELRKIFTGSQYINSLLTASIAALSPEAVMNFKDSSGNSIPTVKQSNLSHEKATTRNLARKKFGNSTGFLFLENPSLQKGVETLLEVKTKNKPVDAFYLNPEENFILNFTENYLKPMKSDKKDENYTSFKLVNFSDKSTILNDLIDQFQDIHWGGNSIGSLKTMNLETVKRITKESIFNYYSHLTDRIIDSYASLLDSEGNPYIKIPKNRQNAINNINAFLKEHKSDFKDIIKKNFKRVEDLKRTTGDATIKSLEFVEEVHYSKYSDGLFFNKTIQGYLSMTDPKNTKDELNDLSEKLFVRKLIEISPKIDLEKFLDLPNLYAKHIQSLYKDLGLEIGDWVTIENGKIKEFIYFKSDGEKHAHITPSLSNLELKGLQVNPLLAKWLHTQNLVRYNSLGLTTKHEYQHPHKTGKSTEDLYGKDSEKGFIEEMTGRSIAMTKRMVVHPATMEYYMQGLDEGIPPEIKLAVIDDISCLSYNFTGTSKKHDAWDGSLASNPFLSFLLKKSLPNKGLTDVQKSIGTYSADTHSVFLKCALFTITNEMVRKSSGSDVNLDSIMRSMNNIPIEPEIDLSKIEQTGNSINLNQLVPDGIFYKVGNKILKVERISKVKDSTYQINLTDKNSATEEPYVINKDINNLYDLWQVFGGAYSRTKKGNEYVYSDASIEAVGGLISIIKDSNGKLILKDKMIGILAQKSSVKNGAGNINETSVLKTEYTDNGKVKVKDLMYTYFDTHFFGVQLDAYHISDESVVTEISQVISALAENQATPELYSELYSAIGEIIKAELDEYNKKFKVDGKYNIQKISEDFVNILGRGREIGNSKEIADALKSAGIKNLPISNNNFFNTFVINVISKLSSDFIKRKYPGIAAVLNPSYGMMQLYEDENGNTYFHDDLIDLATDEESNISLELTPHEQNFDIINRVIGRMFPNKILSNEEFGTIKPLDVINISGSIEEKNNKVWDLKDISNYYKLKQLLSLEPTVIVEKINNKPRDLKPVEISFIQNGRTRNIFDNDPIRLTWALTNNELTEEDSKILLNLANYFISKENPGAIVTDIIAAKPYILGKLNLWNKRSFELLKHKFNFKEVTSESDFNEIFGEDDFKNAVDFSKYKGLDQITGYTHKPAEIIMPKVYRSQFGINYDSFSKIQRNGKFYFEEKIQEVVKPATKECDLYLSSLSGNSLYISILNEEEIAEKVDSGEFHKIDLITKEIEGKQFRVDIKGDPIYRINPNLEVYEKNGVEFIVFKNRKGITDDVTNFIKNVRSGFEFIFPFSYNSPEYFQVFKNITKKYSVIPIYSAVVSKYLESITPEYSRIQKKANKIITGVLGNEAQEAFDEQSLIDQLPELFDDSVSRITKKLAESIHSSWLKSNDQIAARIPSQAMQSFMSMKTIGYNEEAGNNVYVSHWQLWLQGSDFRPTILESL